MRRAADMALLAAAAGCLWAAGACHAPLARMRTSAGMDAAEPIEDAPPDVVFTTVVLGGFRGVLADILWLRAAQLQDQGRYFELVQLSDWITRLEPRHSEVWAFHAWNMAYNASAMMPGAEDRWRWVQNGIRLLRDEGLRRNPGDPLLYRELGWLFADKIGGYSDSEHMYYRVRWAAEMTALLGGGRAAAAAARPETARRMSAEYGLEPALMAEVEAEHGLQDWRLPEPHSLYWARRGRARAGARGSLECDRMICQALAARFMQGWLRFSPEEGVYATGPAPGAYAAALSALESARARHGGMMDAALGQFLRDAALVLHEFGREAEARDAFLRLQRELPSDPAAAAGFDAFIEQRTSPEGMRDGPLRRAVAVVEGTCFRGELLRAAGRGAEAEALEERARSLWEARAGGEDADERRRMGFPEFEEIRAQAALRAREETPGTPPGPAGRGNGAGGGA